MSKKPTKEYNLGVLYPHLIDEFHPTLNEKTIFDYLPKSGKKVFWKCEKHDHYRQSIEKKTSRGQGCSYCSGRYAHPEDNLKTNYPELIEEWHPTKNKKRMEEYPSGSNHKVYWLCSTKKWGVRHTYEEFITHRTRRKIGCPYCSGHKPSKEYNLEKLYPELMDEWDYSKNNRTPSDYTPYSAQYVWWICKKSNLHNYRTRINRRTGKQKTGCPFCVGKQICEDNNLMFKKPDLIEELHPDKNGYFDPSKIYYYSVKKVWWKCSRGHEWKTQINIRVNGHDCPKCSGKSSKFELRMVSELEKIIGKVEHRKKIEGIEIDVYLPYYKIGLEYDGWYYHRKNIHKDKQKNIELKKLGIQVIRVREEGGGGQLPKISRKDILHKKTDKEIDVIKKILISLTKTIEFSKSRRKIVDRYLNHDKLCNDKKYFEYLDQILKPSFNKSLQNTHPELLEYWHPTKNGNLKPTDISFGSHLKVWWICKYEKNHDHLETPLKRKSRGCPLCPKQYHRKVVPLKKSLEFNNPELSKLFDTKKNSIFPRDIYKGSSKKYWWKCEKGIDHEWFSTINDVKRGKYYCPFCFGYRVSITNCLDTMFPEVSKEFHPTKNGDITPRNVYHGSHKKIWFVCNKGHEWETPLYVRTRMGCGCPYCSGNKIWKEEN